MSGSTHVWIPRPIKTVPELGTPFGEFKEEPVASSPETALSQRTISGLANPLTCRFCDELPEEQTVLDDPAAFAVASIGGFVDGWLLVSPRRHVLALSELTTTEWSEYDRTLTSARELVEATYGTSVLFEHGSSGLGRTAGCGVDHAHMHIVALDLDLRSAVAAIRDAVGQYDWITSTDRPKGMPGHDYIYLKDHTGAWISHARHLPSQVVRRAIASTLGVVDWDWKQNRQESRVRRVAELLRGPVSA
jgi:ATP adenylyltransferase